MLFEVKTYFHYIHFSALMKNVQKAGTVFLLLLHIWSSHPKYSDSSWLVNSYCTQNTKTSNTENNSTIFVSSTTQLKSAIRLLYVQNDTQSVTTQKNTDNNLPDQSIPTIISQSVFKNFSYSLFCAFM